MGDLFQSRVPAIVLGQGATALGILRSLHIAGIPAFVACPAQDLVTHSRWYRPTPGPRPWEGTLGETAWNALGNMPVDRAVIIPGADDAAMWVTDVPASGLGARFLVSSSTRHVQEVLQDKSQFSDLLDEIGVPKPRTFRIRSLEDIDAIPFDALDRVFIKPVNSQRFSDVTGVKGVWVKRVEDLRDTWQRLDAQGFTLMAQEYVPGTPADHFFVDGFRDRDGCLTGLFARQRIRISPPDFGNSSYCRSIALDDIRAPVNDVSKLLERVGYRGIFSAEFKRDARDGVFRILEVNTRAWTFVEFATRCGVNVCEMAYQDALGLPVRQAPADYPIGAGCVDFHRDLGTVRAQPRSARGPMHRILAQWARSHFHVLRMDDPLPGLESARQAVRRYWRLRRQGAR